MKTQILSKEQFESPANQNRDNAIVGYREVPQQYRELRAGEIIQLGDQIKNGMGEWCDCKNMIGSTWNPGPLKAVVRRPLR